MSKTVKGYKGFDKDFKCQNKQYEENTTYEEHGVKICEEGMMHFCENPFDVLDYYPLLDDDANFNQFAKVEGLGDIERQENKTASNKLHIGAKLSFKDFIKACINFTFESAKVDKSKKVDSNNSASAQMASSGDSAQMASSGFSAKMASSGISAQMASSGDSAKMASSGDSAKMASSGDYAKMASSGDSAKMASSGDSNTIKSEGVGAVVAAIGVDNIASAKKGSWITLAEYEKKFDEECTFSGYKPICVKTEYVDGERIKENTFYKLENGEFTEVE